MGLIWLVPVLGSFLYWMLGINRIERKAARLREGMARYRVAAAGEVPPDHVISALGRHAGHLADLARMVGRVTSRPLLSGNRVEPLDCGDEAYPAMLAAIRSAERSVTLCTFLFDDDTTGREFVEALAAARERGVEVRVILDDAGARFPNRSVARHLRAHGVRFERFLPVLVPWRTPYFNLRNHRKILVVDGRLGFTGGMNIRHGHRLAADPDEPVRDVHFRMEGPVVAQLQEVFAEDWQFCSGEALEGEAWFPKLAPAGWTLARGIADGPDEDLNILRWAFHGAVVAACRTVRVATPYFLPDYALDDALMAAAMRGVDVEIFLPERSDHRIVDWAMRDGLRWLLDRGCRIWMTPAPFDHAKLLTVDGAWTCFGSGNWDPRSLRLNFEFNVECYDPELAVKVDTLFDARRKGARPLARSDLEGRSLPICLRDGVSRLFSPYL